jgi:cell division protein ZapA (FtsZ GTPase activity inhibitor)
MPRDDKVFEIRQQLGELRDDDILGLITLTMALADEVSKLRADLENERRSTNKAINDLSQSVNS